MAQSMNKQDIIYTLYGAAFLAGGGGGALSLGLQLIDMLEKDGYSVEANLTKLDDAPQDEFFGMTAGLGAPSNVVMAKFEQDLPGAFAALKEAYRVDGGTVSGIYSGEMGGFNTMVAIMLHIVSSDTPAERIMFLDADGNGRAVPELNTCLVSARGFPPTPVGVAGHDLNSTEIENRYVAWTRKTDADTVEEIAKRSESIARSIAIQYGQVGFSTWALQPDQLRADGAEAYVFIAYSIGVVLNWGGSWDGNKLNSIASILGSKARQLCIGTVKSFTNDVSGGFDVGRVTIQGDDGKTYAIDYQNENIVIFEDGEAIMTAPDRITIIEVDNCVALTNVDTDITIGKNVAVILSAAHEHWWATDKNAYRAWDNIFDRVKYDGDYIDYDGTHHPRV